MGVKSRLPLALTLVYGLVWVGWLFHRSRRPWMLGFSPSWIAFLGVTASGFFVPWASPRILRAVGARRLVFSLIPVGVLGLLIHGAARLHHDFTTEHRFDPFVGVPAPRAPVPMSTACRILALGGSSTEGIGLSPQESYPSVMERELRRRNPERPVQVHNGGRVWYTTRHSLVNLATRYDQWKPSVVIVMHGLNDLCRSFSPPGYALGDYDDGWGHFYGPAMDGARPPPFERSLLESLGLHWAFENWYGSLRHRERPYDLTQFKSMPLFEDNLRRLVRFCRFIGAQPVLVTEPTLYRSTMDHDALDSLWFARTFCCRPVSFLCREFPSVSSMATAMEEINRRVRHVAKAESAALVDADADLPKDLANLYDDVHHTARGAQRVGALIARHLIDAGLTVPR